MSSLRVVLLDDSNAAARSNEEDWTVLLVGTTYHTGPHSSTFTAQHSNSTLLSTPSYLILSVISIIYAIPKLIILYKNKQSLSSPNITRTLISNMDGLLMYSCIQHPPDPPLHPIPS